MPKKKTKFGKIVSFNLNTRTIGIIERISDTGSVNKSVVVEKAIEKLWNDILEQHEKDKLLINNNQKEAVSELYN